MAYNAGHLDGLYYYQAWRMDSSDYMLGTESDPDNVSNDTTASARLIEGVVTNDVTQPSGTVLSFRSGNSVVGTRLMAPAEGTSGTFETEVVDLVFNAMADGSLVDTTTVSGWTIAGLNNRKSTLNKLGICVSQMGQSRDSGSDGTDFWEHHFFKAEVRPKYPAAAFQSVSQATHDVAVHQITKFPNGVAFGSAQGLYQNATDTGLLRTSNPIAFTTYVADGVTTTFTLPYLPTSSVVTAATAPNFMAINGTETAPSSINTSTGVVTLAAAGTAGDIVTIIYETAFATA